ncbi:MAG TPA: TonB-dependent receptor [Vicinamibacteria bacterium]|nr:TonB-dependent receptor [Vicinamibacteria bacterium]
MRFRLFGALAAAALLAAPLATAQEVTGAIVGAVRAQDGALLPGATVTATGPIGNVQAVSDEKGEYRFPRLPSGVYKVTAALSGFTSGERTVNLTVGSTNRADFTLGVAAVTETISVVSEASVIDLTSSSTTTNISRERIDYVPRGRDFTDVVTQAAGAADESQAGGISIDGSSGSENRFVIDGIDTTDPQEGISAVPLRADFLEEVQVKSAGYSAEYGGSTGGVINVITKSGTNIWRGGVLAQYEDRSLGGDEPALLRDSLTESTFTYINPPKDDERRIDPGLFVGGPIFKDRLWFFGSYQPGIRKTERTVHFSNGVVNTFPQDFRVNYGTANITGNLGSKVLFRVGANFSPYTTEKSLPNRDGRTSLTDQDDWLRGTEGKRNTYSGSIDYTPTSNFVVSARAGRYRTDEETTGIEFPDLIHQFSTASTPAGIAAIPAQYRKSAGFLSDVLITDATTRNEYKRDYVGIDATMFFNGLGEHQIKGGFQTEKISNDVDQGYNADRILYYAGRTYRTSTGQTVSGQYGYFRLLNISTLGKVESRNEALFIQDTWKVIPRLTLNIGVRAEHERIPNFGERGVKNPIEFKWSEKLAPRLGFSFDVLGDAKWKLYGSYGKYYDVMKYEMPRGSFGGDKWVDYFYTWDNPNYQANGAGCSTGSNTISERPTCAGGTFIEPLDRRFNSAEDPDSGIDPDLKPMQQAEYQIGITHELTSNVVLGARFIRKNLVRTIEDVGIVVPGVGEVYYIANPGEGISLSLNDPGIPGFPTAKREYTGLELTFQKRVSNGWGLFGSYTYSKLHGNYSGLASSDEDGRTSPNVNRFFDHIENSFDRNADLVYGPLGTDRPHQFKAQFIYETKWDMNVSVNQYVGSGIPISEEAFVGAAIPFFPYGRDNLARTDTLSQTDLSIFQDFKLGRFDLQLGVTVLNLLDQNAVTRRYNNRTSGSVPVTTDQFFAGGWDYEALLAANPNLLDVKFNQPDQYQDPRAVRFSVRFQF